MKKIENRAFANCDRLTNIQIGDLVTEIGDEAFYDCARINEVKIPVAVTKVGKGAFDLCAELTDIYLYSGDADLLGQQTFANPNCHIFVQTKDFDNYQTSWEKNLYVAGQSDQNAIVPDKPVWWKNQEKIEFASDTQPGDRVIAAITMILKDMKLGDTTVDEEYDKDGYYNEDYGNKNLHRYHPGASASYSTIAPVKHENEYWSSKEERVASTDDGPGKFTITGVGPGIVRVETENYYYHDYDVKIYPQKGDANWDGGFDVSDAVNIANHVVKNRNTLSNWTSGKWMGEENWEHFYQPGADVNGDGSISVSDASAAVKIVLNKPTKESSPSKIRAASSYDDYDSDALVIGKPNGAIIPIALDNSMEYVALQADIRVPEGMKIEDVKAGLRGAEHGLSTRRFDDRTMRVVLFDLNNSAFEELDEPILQLSVSGDCELAEDIEIFSIVASDITSESHKLIARAGADISGVDSISKESGNHVSPAPDGVLISNAEGKTVRVCTLDGALIRSFEAKSESELIPLAQGIYIVTVDNESFKISVK